MDIFKLILIVFYFLLVILNYKGYIDNRQMWLLTLVTTIVSTTMLCSANAADLEWRDTELDISGYRTLYEKYDVLEHVDFRMYYLFYSCMYLGQTMGLSFRTWWTIMSVLAMGVIFVACKVHKYNFNLFLAAFMAYHEIVFYAGFKFFYGFCFLLLAFGFLFTNSRKRLLLFALFTCVAGGFHVMYYFYLVLLLKPLKNPRLFVGIIVGITVVFTIILRLSGSALSFMAPFFNAIDNEHIDKYTTVSVKAGFFFPILIHLVVVYIAYKIRAFMIKEGKDINNADTLYYSVLLSLLFCPFYAIALTFMRLITAFSLVVITASSSLLSGSYKSRLLCVQMSLLFVVSSYLMRIVMGGFVQTSIIPYFDVL